MQCRITASTCVVSRPLTPPGTGAWLTDFALTRCREPTGEYYERACSTDVTCARFRIILRRHEPEIEASDLSSSICRKDFRNGKLAERMQSTVAIVLNANRGTDVDETMRASNILNQVSNECPEDVQWDDRDRRDDWWRLATWFTPARGAGVNQVAGRVKFGLVAGHRRTIEVRKSVALDVTLR